MLTEYATTEPSGSRCQQNFKCVNSVDVVVLLRTTRNSSNCVPHVQHAYFASFDQSKRAKRYCCLSCRGCNCKSCCLRQTVNILPVFLQFKRNAKVQEERKVCSHSCAANGEESSVLLVRHRLRFPQHSFNVRRALWSTQMARQVSRLVLLYVCTSMMRRLAIYFEIIKLRF